MPQESQQTAPWEAPAEGQAPWGPEHPQQASPAPEKPASQFEKDTATTDAWAEGHPVAGPAARFLVRGGQAAANAIMHPEGLLAPVLHPKDTFNAVKNAAMDYAHGNISPTGAKSVLPEALGEGLGSTAGGAVYGKMGSMAGEGIKSIPNVKGGIKAVASDIPIVRKMGAFLQDPMQADTAQAIKEGRAARIPTSGPRSVGAQAEAAEPAPAGISTPKSRLIMTPSELQAHDQMMRIASENASERGMQYAGGMKPAPGKIQMGPGAATEETSGVRTPEQHARIQRAGGNLPSVSGGSQEAARMGPERRISTGPYAGTERRIRVDEEGNPVMAPHLQEAWQESVFGQKPESVDIGAKVRAAAPEPTRAETKIGQLSKFSKEDLQSIRQALEEEMAKR
jgi:hypothetical protein